MTPSEVLFVADGMLQSLGTWLRLMGYDCVSQRGTSSRSLLEQAIAEQRVFLTRNVHLGKTLPKLLLGRGQILYVRGIHLPEQLREVIHQFRLETATHAFTRCLQCNAGLERTTLTPDDLPPKVVANKQDFWRCPSCERTFWRGSHVDNSLKRLREWLKN